MQLLQPHSPRDKCEDAAGGEAAVEWVVVGEVGGETTAGMRLHRTTESEEEERDRENDMDSEKMIIEKKRERKKDGWM